MPTATQLRTPEALTPEQRAYAEFHMDICRYEVPIWDERDAEIASLRAALTSIQRTADAALSDCQDRSDAFQAARLEAAMETVQRVIKAAL